MSLRDLFIGVDFDVNEKELRKGDNAVSDLTGETKKAGHEMKTLDKNSKRAGSSIGKIARRIGALVGLYEIGRGLKYAVGQAAALEEQTAKFNTVFGQFSGEASAWAVEYADKVGRSVIETKGAIAENQNLLVGFGATRKEALGMSTNIQSLAVDLASFNDIQDETASNNIRSVLLGQHQAGKSLGLAITETSLNQLALSEGYKETFRNLDPLTKMQLRYKLMVNQSADTIGDAERTAGSYTNQMKRLKGNLKDVAAEAGMTLLPMLRDLAVSVNENKEGIKDFIVGGVTVLAAGFKGLIGVGKVLIGIFNIFEPVIWGLTAAFAAQKLVALQATIAQWSLNGAMAANPFGAVALGIGLVVLGVKLLYDHFDGFRRLWDKHIGPIWDKIQGFLGLGDIDVNQNTTTTAGYASGTDANQNTTPEKKYASGTNNARAGLALVGERGPELVSMNGGEKVFKNKETKNIFRNNTQNEKAFNDNETNLFNKETNDISNRNSQTNNISVNVTVNGDSDGNQAATKIVNEIDNYFRRMKLKGGYA